jgi:hypothetical protein
MKKMTTKLSLPILTLGFLLLISCDDKTKNEGNESSVPKQIISINQAVEMKNEYNNTISPLIEAGKSSDNDQYQATEFAYIDLDSLKKYVAFLEKVEKLNNKKISGLRFYFAAYPNQNKFTSVNKETKYLGRETFFIAPTIEVDETELSKTYSHLKNVPFSIVPSGSNKYKGDFKSINALFTIENSVNKISIYQNSTNGKAQTVEATSLILNELQLTPPPKK